MKYSIKYYGGNSANAKADELILLWHEDDTAEGIKKFIETYPNAESIIIDLSEYAGSALEAIGTIKNAKNDIVSVMINYEVHKDIAKDISGIKWFYDLRVDNFDTVKELIAEGVSQIYITGDLGFNMTEVASYCHNNQVLVRCFPNVAQHSDANSRHNKNESRFWSFFIRPEDEMFYSGKIDYYEFYGPLDRQSVLMRIYKSRKWLGDLKILILGLDKSVMSYNIAPMWGQARLNCKHRCDRCKICDATLDLAGAMADSGIMVDIDYGKEVTEHYLQQIKDSIALEK